MLRSRISPSLLIRDGGLVKTVKFSDGKYVGDPINAVKIFNEKGVDELCVFDIDATTKNREPDYSLIEKMAQESRMPLCYGGGIKTAAQARRIVQSGVEKVAISSVLEEDPAIIKEMANAIGSQSVVVVLDVKKSLFGSYDLYTHNGKKKSKRSIEELCSLAMQSGAGEVIVNSIDNDGVMKGYDLKLVKKIRDLVDTPMTVLGGAGSIEDLKALTDKFGPIGASAGSLFVFKGRYKAVLINYLSDEDKVFIHGH